MLLMIDNYDSFTWMLVQYFRELGEEVVVRRNDEIDTDGILALKPDRLCISPGPSNPDNAGVSCDADPHPGRHGADPRRLASATSASPACTDTRSCGPAGRYTARRR